MAFLSFALSFFHGVSTEKPPASATPSWRPVKYSLRAPAHGASAPSANDSESSGTTSSGSTS